LKLTSDTPSPSKETIDSLALECRATVKAYQEEIDSLTRRCKLAENSFVQLYTSIYECRDPASVIEQALQLIEARDRQVDNLLKGMEELNEEVEAISGERDGLRLELEEARDSGGGGSGKKDELGGGELSLAEREELIRLRGEVAEYEGELL
jgi:homeobox protein cut-like